MRDRHSIVKHTQYPIMQGYPLILIICILLLHNTLLIARPEPQSRTRHITILSLASPSAPSPTPTANNTREQPRLTVQRNSTRGARQALRLFRLCRLNDGERARIHSQARAAIVFRSCRRSWSSLQTAHVGGRAGGLEASDLGWR